MGATGYRHFPSDPDQVGAARQFVLGHVDATHPCRHEIELCTSEVVTNAITHPAAERRAAGVSVVVMVEAVEVTVTVWDGGGTSVPAVRRGRGGQRVGGRGMAIVDALAEEWGFHRGEDNSTTVWFVLRAPTCA